MIANFLNGKKQRRRRGRKRKSSAISIVKNNHAFFNTIFLKYVFLNLMYFFNSVVQLSSNKNLCKNKIFVYFSLAKSIKNKYILILSLLNWSTKANSIKTIIVLKKILVLYLSKYMDICGLLCSNIH